ncbi:MAG: photosynthetic complex assembly protein PuhC [Parvularcula sp.]|jgi:putative photosynthetic complex assembly protein|nr:photosynthetic complex assembly protein PuhC [Parvularcula sp.]
MTTASAPQSHHAPIVPNDRWLFIGLGLLAAFSLVAITIGHSKGGKTYETLPPLSEQRSLIFEDSVNGDIQVKDAASNLVIGQFGSGEGAFVRTAMRSLAYTRRLNGIGAEAPFVLGRTADGRTYLHDPSTGKSISLYAFGDANVDQFTHLLAGTEVSQ